MIKVLFDAEEYESETHRPALAAGLLALIAALSISRYPTRQAASCVDRSSLTEILSLTSGQNSRRRFCSTKQTIVSRSGLRSFKRLAVQHPHGLLFTARNLKATQTSSISTGKGN